MARRIDIELTSNRGDGSWTWRAAGAKAPKGVVDEKVLYEGARVGDVVRAEAEFNLDGIELTSVQPPKARPSTPQVLEIKGSGRDEGPLVTSSLVPKSDRPRRDSRDRDGRPPRRDGEGRGGPRPDRGGPRPDRDARGTAREGRSDRPDRAARPDRPARPERRDRPAAKAAPERPRTKRLNPANVHRKAVLDALSPDQRPIAEQVLRGGIPAVRRAVEEQNVKARAEGAPEIPGDAVVTMAEGLLPSLKLADWRDRADAALTDVDEIGLRDLRSVVAGSDAVARDDETRALATQLKEALNRRLEKGRDEWVRRITTDLEEGRIVRALRDASRPPDPSLRFPADLAKRLSDAAGEALAADAPADRWMALLEAVVASPVRRTVKPAGLPSEPTPPLLQAARNAAGHVPALAPLLGMDVPPPPTPLKPQARGGRAPAKKGAPPRPRPPIPAPPAAPAPTATDTAAPTAPVDSVDSVVTDGMSPKPTSEATPDPVTEPTPESPAPERGVEEAAAEPSAAAPAAAHDAPAEPTPDAPAEEAPISVPSAGAAPVAPEAEPGEETTD